MDGDYIMLIILERTTKKILENYGTNSLFPDGNLPLQEKPNELFVRIHDDSEIASKILSAHEYTLILNDQDEATGVTVHQTLEEYQAAQPPVEPVPSESDELASYMLDMDYRLTMMEMGL